MLMYTFTNSVRIMGGNIRLYLRELGWEVWIGSLWLRIGTNGGLL
jgi:hypothetical protein